MRTITCPICGERRVGVHVCVPCYHRLNAEFGGTGWLTADWFKFLERATWREAKADLAQEKLAEQLVRLAVKANKKTRFERAVELLQEGERPEVVSAALSGPTANRFKRSKDRALVRRALEHLGETYRPREEVEVEGTEADEGEILYTKVYKS